MYVWKHKTRRDRRAEGRRRRGRERSSTAAELLALSEGGAFASKRERARANNMLSPPRAPPSSPRPFAQLKVAESEHERKRRQNEIKMMNRAASEACTAAEIYVKTPDGQAEVVAVADQIQKTRDEEKAAADAAKADEEQRAAIEAKLKAKSGADAGAAATPAGGGVGGRGEREGDAAARAELDKLDKAAAKAAKEEKEQRSRRRGTGRCADADQFDADGGGSISRSRWRRCSRRSRSPSRRTSSPT